ncbi:hypothetical protein GCM10010112_65420 [Actinoplanes lobatus]|uniref:Uncharacterized protein n=1 Tax=Actinoplanes lobatus TaxID=113568 RepID=A0A7W7MIV7_9ACTN|nr:hypothetical protein [Actinoplanes lobatus]MBB4751982.1 hypothetical protein [Actinoplanes lobatus]GGN85219.1 hypothetical protein GCM10010112_65420 [Actinoplanes lobatus]GIE44291.1 hypothetical protein Alo02nite_71890 [Actinoplanes lobatus]
MSAEPLPILEDAYLAGPAATLAEMDGADDVVVAAAIEERMTGYGLAVPGARGPGGLQRLLDRLRGRVLRADLGVHPAEVPWLRFHVPPGGSAQLVLERQVERKGGVTLKFMGLGSGSGRSVTLGAEQDFGDRADCFTLGAKLDVRLRVYADDGRDSVQVDVERVVGTSLASRVPCGFCFRAPEPGPQPRKLDREWDLEDDPHGLTETLTHETLNASDLEIGLEIPGVDLGGLTPGLTCSRSVTSTCTATYRFPGNACFRAYTEILPGLDLPFWGRS